MSKELFNQPLSSLDDSDRLSAGQPGQVGAKNITWANVKSALLALARPFIQFIPQPTPPPRSEGLIYYDDVKKCIILFDDIENTSVEIGVEIPMRVINNTGSTITNGKACYISGAVGGLPTIALADCSTYEKSRVIVVATHDILTGEQGKAVRMGIVHDAPTAESFSLGETAYIKLGEMGGISSTPPTGGNYKVALGKVIKVGGGFIDLEVNISASEYTVETLSERGFPEPTDLTLTWDNGTRTLTIAPIGASYYYYDHGEKIIKTAPENLQIPNTEGNYFFYYSGSTLSYLFNGTPAQTADLIRYSQPVAYIYWDATNARATWEGMELHCSIGYGIENHVKDHLTIGAMYGGGFDPNTIGIGGSGDLSAHAQFGINGGIIFDEDIRHAITAITAANGVNRVMYNSAAGFPRYGKIAGFSVLTAGTGRLAYNPVGSGLVECPDNTFVWCHVFGTGSLVAADGIVSFVGKAAYASNTLAFSGHAAEIATIRATGLPSPEFKVLASFLFQTRDTYANAVNARIVAADANGSQFVDLRSNVGAGSGGTGGGVVVVESADVLLTTVPIGSTANNQDELNIEIYDRVEGHLIKDSISTLQQKPNLKLEGLNIENIGDDTIVKSVTESTYSGSLALNKRKETYFNPYFQTSDTVIPTPSGALGNGQTIILPFVGNGVNTLSFSQDWKEIKNEFVSTTAKYWLITGVRIAGQWFYKVEATNATAIANPDFVTGTWASNNAYVDIQFNTPVYGDNMASTPIELLDLLFTYYSNGGGATNWVPSTLTKTTGLPLTGGETVVRLNGVITGSSTGVEYAVIQPSTGSAIFNSIGVGMLSSATTGNLTLSNQADIVTQLKAIVAWDTLLLAENYDTTTRVWNNQGDLAGNAVADGAYDSPNTKTSNWSNGHQAVDFNSKTLTLGTYPLFSQLVTSIVIGEMTTEVGAALYNAGYYGLEWGSGRFGYQGINSFIGVDRSYVGKKFISVFANKSMSASGTTTTSLLFQNGDSNKYATGGTSALNKANLGGRPSSTGSLNGKIAFMGKTTGTPTPAQIKSIINTLDSYYNILEDKKYILFEGDSLTYGIGAGQFTAYPTVLIQNLETAHSEIVRYCDLSISGNKWSYVEGSTPSSDYSTTPMITLNRYSNSNKMCVVWLGTNDVVGGVTAATMLASTTQYINKMIANGCTKFIVLPIIPRVGISGSTLTQAQNYNASLSTLSVPGASIRFVDLVSDPRLDDYTDLTYYGADQIHLTVAGYAVVAELVKPKIDELFWPV